jgi:hypothetical protein
LTFPCGSPVQKDAGAERAHEEQRERPIERIEIRLQELTTLQTVVADSSLAREQCVTLLVLVVCWSAGLCRSQRQRAEREASARIPHGGVALWCGKDHLQLAQRTRFRFVKAQ